MRLSCTAAAIAAHCLSNGGQSAATKTLWIRVFLPSAVKAASWRRDPVHKVFVAAVCPRAGRQWAAALQLALVLQLHTQQAISGKFSFTTPNPLACQYPTCRHRVLSFLPH